MRRGRALAWAAETNRPQCPPPETRVRTRRGPEHLEAPRPTPAQKVLVERHGKRDPHPILVFLVAPVCCLPKAEPVSEVLLHVKRHEGAVGGEVGRDRRLQRCDRPVPEIFAPQDGPCEAGHRTRRALVPNPARGRRPPARWRIPHHHRTRRRRRLEASRSPAFPSHSTGGTPTSNSVCSRAPRLGPRSGTPRWCRSP